MAVCLVNLRPVVFVTAVFTVACFVLSGLTVFAQPDVSASCAALMVAETGELIYGKNEHDRGLSTECFCSPATMLRMLPR